MSLSTEVLNEAVTPVATASRRFYQPELDGLRFYAFLGVFVCHTLPFEASFYHNLHLPLPWLWGATVKAGAAGVDLFFALSAFLITSLLLKERDETGDISLKLFYARRILRIWPLYFVVIGLAVLRILRGGRPLLHLGPPAAGALVALACLAPGVPVGSTRQVALAGAGLVLGGAMATSTARMWTAGSTRRRTAAAKLAHCSSCRSRARIATTWWSARYLR